ncbi:hypothetical protein MANES_11G072833v8 [Manihot esculenta]|uniref:Uncharacterized protein n=1 Tax=Manihot esculenta TaxID=3983 RepID=A0ACB7GV42_MANES|nr:hypothetical protein MANES_11G072833v8 [Manihot esculenta]
MFELKLLLLLFIKTELCRNFSKTMDISEEVEDEEKELEHSSLQEKLDRKLQELDKRLEQKEEEDLHPENVYYSEMKDAGFFDADWE